MASDVFIISAARDADPATAIRQALELAGISPSQVQDAVFGVDSHAAMLDAKPIASGAGLSCPAAGVQTSMRAIFFAAASMLSDDAELSVIIALETEASTAFVLGSPEAVGRLNLLPRARIAARSLAGHEPALRAAGIEPTDVEISKASEQAGLLLYGLLEELEAQGARWGMISGNEAVIVIERV